MFDSERILHDGKAASIARLIPLLDSLLQFLRATTQGGHFQGSFLVHTARPDFLLRVGHLEHQDLTRAHSILRQGFSQL